MRKHQLFLLAQWIPSTTEEQLWLILPHSIPSFMCIKKNCIFGESTSWTRPWSKLVVCQPKLFFFLLEVGRGSNWIKRWNANGTGGCRCAERFPPKVCSSAQKLAEVSRGNRSPMVKDQVRKY
jgi:hypothetical protein